MLKRLLQLNMPIGQSIFLWGARKTGKSTYLEKHFPNSIYYDFLKTELSLQFSKNPQEFREEILALSEQELQKPIILDEIQKIPVLLDEIHWLIEHRKPAYFILCGSSARKLKKTGANFLGGRAWRYTFYPLVYPEIPNFDLLKALNAGLIPSHYLSSNPHKTLKSYVHDYLTEEIKAEGLTRDLPMFARFLDTVAFCNGELVNYTNIARDCGIDAKTVQAYYEILVDTLLGYYVMPYTKTINRQLIHATPKFYLFDTGVTNSITKNSIGTLKGIEAGRSFEQYIMMELMAYKGLNDLDFDIRFWRTKQGLEVDFILGKGEVAIEVKISDHVSKKDIKGLVAFTQEYHPKNSFVVCLSPRKRKILLEHGEITVLPYKEFLTKLWEHEIINK